MTSRPVWTLIILMSSVAVYDRLPYNSTEYEEANILPTLSIHETPQDPSASELTLHIGDAVWGGRYVEAIYPLSGTLVRGGGHSVFLAPHGHANNLCQYHIPKGGTVHVAMDGTEFLMRMNEDGTINAEHKQTLLAGTP